jgi:hypothetical protein
MRGASGGGKSKHPNTTICDSGGGGGGGGDIGSVSGDSGDSRVDDGENTFAENDQGWNVPRLVQSCNPDLAYLTSRKFDQGEKINTYPVVLAEVRFCFTLNMGLC